MKTKTRGSRLETYELRPIGRGVVRTITGCDGFSWPSFNTGVDVDFQHKGISATRPLAAPIGKSSLSHGGEGSLGLR